MMSSDLSSFPRSAFPGPKLSVVVPCYNEELSLTELHRRISAIATACFAQDYELVLVDDGSKDRTREMIRALAQGDPHVVAVFLSRNHGHQLALTAGLRVCRGERILILDADLQDPPELLPEMLKIMTAGADVVYGKRIKRQGETVFKNLSAHIFYRVLNRLVEIEIPSDAGDFRLMSRRALDALNQLPECHRYIRGLVSWIGFRQEPLYYEREERYAGETKYTLPKMISLAFDALSSFSIAPLRLAMYLSLFCFSVGIFFFIWTGVSYIAGVALQGWTTLMTVVLILGSGQLLVLGVMGEYLGRVYIQSKNRPLFLIEEIITTRVIEAPNGESAQTKSLSFSSEAL